MAWAGRPPTAREVRQFAHTVLADEFSPEANADIEGALVAELARLDLDAHPETRRALVTELAFFVEPEPILARIAAARGGLRRAWVAVGRLRLGHDGLSVGWARFRDGLLAIQDLTPEDLEPLLRGAAGVRDLAIRELVPHVASRDRRAAVGGGEGAS